MEKSSGVALAFTREEWLNTGVLWSLEKTKTWLDENSTQIGPGSLKCICLDWIYGAWFNQRATLYLSIATVMWGHPKHPPPPWLMKIKSNSVFVYVRIKLLFASSGSASVRDREKEPLYVQNFVPTLIEHIIDHMFWLDFVFTLFLCFFFKGKLGV